MSCSDIPPNIPKNECGENYQTIKKLEFNPETKEVFIDGVLAGINGQLSEDKSTLKFDSI